MLSNFPKLLRSSSNPARRSTLLLPPSLLGQGLAFALVILFCLGCGYRRPVGEDAGGGGGPTLNDAGVPLSDGLIQLPDGPRPDGPTICDEPRKALKLHEDPRGHFVVALQPSLKVRAVEVPKAPALPSALTIDHPRVAALAFAQRGSGSPLTQLGVLRSSLLAQKGLSITLRASGTTGVSAAGDADVKEAVWNVVTNLPVNISTLRNQLLALFIQRPTEQLGNLPPASSSHLTDRFVLTLSLAVRGDRRLVSMALAAQEHHDANVGADSALIADLGNGTALAPAGRTLAEDGCDRGPAQVRGKADILWVIDESGSMRDNRESIAKHAASFFAKATSAGLDFRMGVTGMIQPGKDGALAGKLCARISQDPKDDGGVDRFLSPSEQKTFLSCVRNPPYEEMGTEYGFAAVREVLTRHLPRAAKDPTRIRRDAKLAIIIVTDEAPQEIKLGGLYDGTYGFLKPGSFGPNQCSLPGDDRAELDAYVQPWLALLDGRSDPEAEATVHLIAGTCGNSCKAEVPHGYRELVEHTGGRMADICQGNLGQTLQVIVDSIVAASSSRVLSQRPVSASLRVTVNGLELPREVNRGFRYNAATNSLSFVNVKLVVGSDVVVSYSRFR